MSVRIQPRRTADPAPRSPLLLGIAVIARRGRWPASRRTAGPPGIVGGRRRLLRRHRHRSTRRSRPYRHPPVAPHDRRPHRRQPGRAGHLGRVAHDRAADRRRGRSPGAARSPRRARRRRPGPGGGRGVCGPSPAGGTAGLRRSTGRHPALALGVAWLVAGAVGMSLPESAPPPFAPDGRRPPGVRGRARGHDLRTAGHPGTGRPGRRWSQRWRAQPRRAVRQRPTCGADHHQKG